MHHNIQRTLSSAGSFFGEIPVCQGPGNLESGGARTALEDSFFVLGFFFFFSSSPAQALPPLFKQTMNFKSFEFEYPVTLKIPVENPHLFTGLTVPVYKC